MFKTWLRQGQNTGFKTGFKEQKSYYIFYGVFCNCSTQGDLKVKEILFGIFPQNESEAGTEMVHLNFWLSVHKGSYQNISNTLRYCSNFN